MEKEITKYREQTTAEKTRSVVSQIAAAFRQVEDFEPFVRGLEAALGKAEFFDRAAITLFPRLKAGEEENEAGFSPATLSLPLSGRDHVHGMAGFSSPRHEFGPEDLHLMAGLADLVTVLLDHALQFGEQRRNLALLGFLLNQVPVGVVCFDRERQILVSNAPGRRLLGIGVGEDSGWTLPEEWMTEVEAVGASGEFHRRVDGQLLHAQVKAASSGSGDAVTALVLADLTPEQEKFHESLARETFRCGWLGRPISLAIITADKPGALMALLRSLRTTFGLSSVVGPCDSDSIGLVFPEATLPQALEKLREARPLLENDWNVGLAVGDEGQGDPEGLFAAAAGARLRVGEFLKHRLLLHDGYASVNDMLELVLRDEFRLFKSSDLDLTMRHLRMGCYDGLFAEADLSNGGSAMELARVARQVNPRIRPFFTSCAADSRREDPLFRREIVFQKPFDVREVVSTVKEVFA